MTFLTIIPYMLSAVFLIFIYMVYVCYFKNGGSVSKAVESMDSTKSFQEKYSIEFEEAKILAKANADLNDKRTERMLQQNDEMIALLKDIKTALENRK